jgi:hypothetical protein
MECSLFCRFPPPSIPQILTCLMIRLLSSSVAEIRFIAMDATLFDFETGAEWVDTILVAGLAGEGLVSAARITNGHLYLLRLQSSADHFCRPSHWLLSLVREPYMLACPHPHPDPRLRIESDGVTQVTRSFERPLLLTGLEDEVTLSIDTGENNCEYCRTVWLRLEFRHCDGRPTECMFLALHVQEEVEEVEEDDEEDEEDDEEEGAEDTEVIITMCLAIVPY